MQLWKIRSLLEKTVDRSLLSIGSHTGGLPQGISHKFNIPLPSREHIPLLTNYYRLNGESVEIGVFKGHFSEHILRYSKLEKLNSIDPWKEFDEQDYADRANVSANVQQQRYESVCQKLKSFSDRSNLMRMTSTEGASHFADNSLDFIYVDANHSYQGCLEDISVWWPKLKENGLMAGDDYYDGDYADTDYGVKKAVTEFFSNKKIPVNITHKSIKTHWPNWYVFKTSSTP